MTGQRSTPILSRNVETKNTPAAVTITIIFAMSSGLIIFATSRGSNPHAYLAGNKSESHNGKQLEPNGVCVVKQHDGLLGCFAGLGEIGPIVYALRDAHFSVLVSL